MPGHQVFLPDAFGVLVAVEIGAGLVRIHPGVGGEFDQGFPVADIPALHETGPEQSLHDRILQAGPASRILGRTARPVDQPVRIEGVGLARHPAEIEVEAGRRPGLPDCGVDVFGPFDAAELGGQVRFPVHAPGRHVRIELERPPADKDIEVRRPSGQCLLEPALADITPRTDRVGNDIDSDFPGHGCSVDCATRNRRAASRPGSNVPGTSARQ